MSQSDGIVVRGGAQGFVQEITAGRHHFISDEPVADGGTDRGPGPYELLLAALDRGTAGPAAGSRREVSGASHAQVRDRYQDDGTTLS